MRIGIITVYDAVNYGSFLQAFALKETVKRISGVEPEMIKDSSLLYEKWRFTSLHTYRSEKRDFKASLRKKYRDCWKTFTRGRLNRHYDLAIVGSDEMWELHNVTMRPRRSYFGIGVNATRLASYAVSSNGTTSKDVQEKPWIQEGLALFDAVGIRDYRTLRTYDKFLQSSPVINLDPTLLIDLDSYAVDPKRRGYILVYSYSLRPGMVKSLKDLAASTGMPLIVAGQQFSWADECVPASPFEFLGLLKNARLVVTDTFHGVTLSLGLRKNFVCDAYKEKVAGALEFFRLEDRDCGSNEPLLDYMSKPIDYGRLEDFISSQRAASFKYLKNQIKLASEL